MPTRAPVTGTVKLWITIDVLTQKQTNTTVYTVTRLDPHPEVGHPAYRLAKTAQCHYDVIRTEHGWACDCPDFTFCRGNHEKGCKHTAAVAQLVRQGLLAELKPEDP